MRRSVTPMISILFLASLLSSGAAAQAAKTQNPTWWSKYQYFVKNSFAFGGNPTLSLLVGNNVDVSNECGPQSETFITINQNKPKSLAAGSNEIFRAPMRGYSSSNGGSTWAGVDLPLPPVNGSNSTNFG